MQILNRPCSKAPHSRLMPQVNVPATGLQGTKNLRLSETWTPGQTPRGACRARRSEPMLNRYRSGDKDLKRPSWPLEQTLAIVFGRLSGSTVAPSPQEKTNIPLAPNGLGYRVLGRCPPVAQVPVDVDHSRPKWPSFFHMFHIH